MPVVKCYRYSRADIRSHPDWLFAFGDNLAGYGFGGQAKEARGEPNAVGIVTKRAPRNDEGAFLRDADLPAVSYHWQRAFTRLNSHLLAGGVVVWPEDGIGTGRAELRTRAPELWRELQLFIAGMESCREVGARFAGELAALAAMPDGAIDLSDIPEQLDWSDAVRGRFKRP